MTLREVAAVLRHLSVDLHVEGIRLETSTDTERWALGRDVQSIAGSVERYADVAERSGTAAGEPTPDERELAMAAADPRRHWPVDHAFGE